MIRIQTLFWISNGQLTDKPFAPRGTAIRHSANILAGDPAYVPLRKYNGVATLLDSEGNWYVRGEFKKGQTWPPGFIVCGHSAATSPELADSVWGWVPSSHSYFNRRLTQALRDDDSRLIRGSTYELCGPGIMHNAEGLKRHQLFRHADAEVCSELVGLQCDYNTLREFFLGALRARRWEGIVWHGPLGVMVKLRVSDFD